jgi:SpoVK/Ycf46/Vps4 family AAA+-type ATPase
MEQRSQEELLSLFRDAMKVGGAAIEMRLRRFASLVRTSDEALARAVTPLVAGTRSLRRESPEIAQPVDADTKLPLVRVEHPSAARVPPLLSPALQAEVDRIIHERKAADRLAAAGLMPVRSVLMSGPPGVGKTMTAGWLAQQLDLPLYTLDLASVMSSFLGKTGANVRSVLNHAQERPCVLLLDEFDSIAKRRDDDTDVGELKRLVTVILQTIDDWSPTSLLVAATNHGELLDPAVWRRFDVTLQFDMPAREQRIALLHSRDVAAPLAEAVAAVTEGQPLSALSRAVDAARKQALLEERGFDEALITWAAAPAPQGSGPARESTKGRRDLEVFLHHCRGLSAREIAELVGTSHMTVVRVLKRLKGEVDAGA